MNQFAPFRENTRPDRQEVCCQTQQKAPTVMLCSAGFVEVLRSPRSAEVCVVSTEDPLADRGRDRGRKGKATTRRAAVRDLAVALGVRPHVLRLQVAADEPEAVQFQLSPNYFPRGLTGLGSGVLAGEEAEDQQHGRRAGPSPPTSPSASPRKVAPFFALHQPQHSRWPFSTSSLAQSGPAGGSHRRLGARAGRHGPRGQG